MLEKEVLSCWLLYPRLCLSGVLGFLNLEIPFAGLSSVHIVKKCICRFFLCPVLEAVILEASPKARVQHT